MYSEEPVMQECMDNQGCNFTVQCTLSKEGVMRGTFATGNVTYVIAASQYAYLNNALSDWYSDLGAAIEAGGGDRSLVPDPESPLTPVIMQGGQ